MSGAIYLAMKTTKNVYMENSDGKLSLTTKKKWEPILKSIGNKLKKILVL